MRIFTVRDGHPALVETCSEHHGAFFTIFPLIDRQQRRNMKESLFFNKTFSQEVPMHIIDALLGEHGVFYALFSHVEHLLESTKDVHTIQSNMKAVDTALRVHAQIENDVLFPHLEPHLGEMGPIQVMRAEHNEIEEKLDAIQSSQSYDELYVLITDLFNIVKNHFAKEEQILFRMGREILDSATANELGFAWAERRKVFVA